MAWPLIAAAGIGAAGSIASGYLAGRNSGKETKMQRTKRKLVDELLGSLSGQGQYANLFQGDDATFQKSIVEPSLTRFRNQVAPQIQQQFIQSGQQRGTGLEDQLTRAGVDLNSMLDEKYIDYQEKGKDRMTNMLNNILGVGDGGTQRMGSGQALGQAGAGYLSSSGFQESLKNIFPNQSAGPTPATTPQTPQGEVNHWDMYAYNQRKGYEQNY